ncbi:MAG: agmatine deiminase family protein [Candidatus Omnitrophica bacterium]|nr:agmatine deiminase family protein [Candidatus Omnitrophota bacterium]
MLCGSPKFTFFICAVFICISLPGWAGKAPNATFPEQMPPEYDNMQGILVAWLPLGPLPEGPISTLTREQIATLNKQSVSEKYNQGHKLGHIFNKNVIEKIKLKKGAGSPDIDIPDGGVYPYHYIMLDLVKAIIDSGAVAHVVVDTPFFQSKIENFLIACGFKLHDLKKIVFHYFWLDSIWIRDYGPWIMKTHNWLSVIDSQYFPSRYMDDMFPNSFSEKFHLPCTKFDSVYTEGGNILTDGLGRGFSTQIILDNNPGLLYDDATSLFEDALNLDEFVFMPGEFPDELDGGLAALGGTCHIDMGLKLLSDTKVMIGDFLSNGPEKAFLDAWAEWFETNLNPNGDPYEVHRVYGATYDYTVYSYLNSIIINKSIIVPQFGDALGDAAAIQSYKNAMPNYKIIGVRSEFLAPLSGGLHCISKEIPNGILKSEDSEMAPVVIGADEADRVNHDDLVWINDLIGDFHLYTAYQDASATSPAVMADTLGYSVGADNPDNFIVQQPDYSNFYYLNPYNNIVVSYPSYGLLMFDFPGDRMLRNELLFPDDPKTAIQQAIYMNPEILVISVGTLDLAAWNGYMNTSEDYFESIVEGILYQVSSIQQENPDAKIVFTTPFDLGAIYIGLYKLMGAEPLPQDVEEDQYATSYADIINDVATDASNLGLNIAVADFTELHKQIATLEGISLGNLPGPVNILWFLPPSPLVTDNLLMTDLLSSIHAYVVIDAINEHYGVNLPLPDLASKLPPLNSTIGSN